MHAQKFPGEKKQKGNSARQSSSGLIALYWALTPCWGGGVGTGGISDAVVRPCPSRVSEASGGIGKALSFARRSQPHARINDPSAAICQSRSLNPTVLADVQARSLHSASLHPARGCRSVIKADVQRGPGFSGGVEGSWSKSTSPIL